MFYRDVIFQIVVIAYFVFMMMTYIQHQYMNKYVIEKMHRLKEVMELHHISLEKRDMVMKDYFQDVYKTSTHIHTQAQEAQAQEAQHNGITITITKKMDENINKMKKKYNTRMFRNNKNKQIT